MEGFLSRSVLPNSQSSGISASRAKLRRSEEASFGRIARKVRRAPRCHSYPCQQFRRREKMIGWCHYQACFGGNRIPTRQNHSFPFTDEAQPPLHSRRSPQPIGENSPSEKLHPNPHRIRRHPPCLLHRRAVADVTKSNGTNRRSRHDQRHNPDGDGAPQHPADRWQTLCPCSGTMKKPAEDSGEGELG